MSEPTTEEGDEVTTARERLREAIATANVDGYTEDWDGLITEVEAEAREQGRIEAHRGFSRTTAAAARIDLAKRIEERLERHGGHLPDVVCIECGDDRPWKTVVRAIVREEAER